MTWRLSSTRIRKPTRLTDANYCDTPTAGRAEGWVRKPGPRNTCSPGSGFRPAREDVEYGADRPCGSRRPGTSVRSGRTAGRGPGTPLRMEGPRCAGAGSPHPLCRRPRDPGPSLTNEEQCHGAWGPAGRPWRVDLPRAFGLPRDRSAHAAMTHARPRDACTPPQPRGGGPGGVDSTITRRRAPASRPGLRTSCPQRASSREESTLHAPLRSDSGPRTLPPPSGLGPARTLTLWSLEQVAIRRPWKSKDTSWMRSLWSAAMLRATNMAAPAPPSSNRTARRRADHSPPGPGSGARTAVLPAGRSRAPAAPRPAPRPIIPCGTPPPPRHTPRGRGYWTSWDAGQSLGCGAACTLRRVRGLSDQVWKLARMRRLRLSSAGLGPESVSSVFGRVSPGDGPGRAAVGAESGQCGRGVCPGLFRAAGAQAPRRSGWARPFPAPHTNPGRCGNGLALLLVPSLAFPPAPPTKNSKILLVLSEANSQTCELQV